MSSETVNRFVFEHSRLDDDTKTRVNKQVFELAETLEAIVSVCETTEPSTQEGCMVVEFGGMLQANINKLNLGSLSLEEYLYELGDVVEQLQEVVETNQPWFARLPKLRSYMKDLTNQVLVKLEAMEVLNTLIDLTDPEGDETA